MHSYIRYSNAYILDVGSPKTGSHKLIIYDNSKRYYSNNYTYSSFPLPAHSQI